MEILRTPCILYYNFDLRAAAIFASRVPNGWLRFGRLIALERERMERERRERERDACVLADSAPYSGMMMRGGQNRSRLLCAAAAAANRP